VNDFRYLARGLIFCSSELREIRTVAEKILIVEDDHLSLKNLCRFLSEEGYQVNCAGNGYEALNLLAKNRFDLVLSDISMPGIDGYELLSHVRASFPSIPVILMSGNFTLAPPALPCPGANALFLKPLDLEKLSDTIEEVLNKRSFV
jgi:CheY-like chemotaxis protein